jgi:hypothetical protein
MFRSKFKPAAFDSFLFNGSISLAMLLLFVIPAFSQTDEAHYVFSNETYVLEFDLADAGMVVKNGLLVNKITGALETGSGAWFRVNMNGVDSDYNGPEGWYDFSTEFCYHTFTLSFQSDSLFLSRSCSNGEPDGEFILTQGLDMNDFEPPTIYESESYEGYLMDEPVFEIAELDGQFFTLLTRAQYDEELLTGLAAFGPGFSIKYDGLLAEANGFNESDVLSFTIKMDSWGNEDLVYPTLQLNDIGLAIFPKTSSEGGIYYALRYTLSGYYELFEPFSGEVFYILIPEPGD